jgi:hypothetical protein
MHLVIVHALQSKGAPKVPRKTLLSLLNFSVINQKAEIIIPLIQILKGHAICTTLIVPNKI